MQSSTTTFDTAPLHKGLAPRTGRLGRRVAVAALVAVFVGLAAFAVIRPSAHYTLARMEPASRKALFDETLRHTQALCEHGDDSPEIRERCAESANFLLAFPECD